MEADGAAPAEEAATVTKLAEVVWMWERASVAGGVAVVAKLFNMSSRTAVILLPA